MIGGRIVILLLVLNLFLNTVFASAATPDFADLRFYCVQDGEITNTITLSDVPAEDLDRFDLTSTLHYDDAFIFNNGEFLYVYDLHISAFDISYVIQISEDMEFETVSYVYEHFDTIVDASLPDPDDEPVQDDGLPQNFYLILISCLLVLANGFLILSFTRKS